MVLNTKEKAMLLMLNVCLYTGEVEGITYPGLFLSLLYSAVPSAVELVY